MNCDAVWKGEEAGPGLLNQALNGELRPALALFAFNSDYDSRNHACNWGEIIGNQGNF